MTAHHIVFLERDSVRAEFRRPDFPHRWDEYPQTAPAEMAQRLHQASIAIINKLPLRAELLAQLPQLRLLAVAATGVNNVDLDYCRAHGIVVSNIRGYAAHTVPEHTLMLMLALKRKLLSYRRDVHNGKWQQAANFCFFDHPISDLHGGTLGIIGGGSLGRGVAHLAQAFGMNVLYAEHKNASVVREGYTAFDSVLREADVLTLHCPLNEQTRHLIGTQELRAMKRDAVLINAARGGLVDEQALAQALNEGWIGGAGFDVLSKEPPVDGNPLLALVQLDLPNFILTPHVAWASNTAMQTLADQLIDNIEAFAGGEPRNQVV